MGKEFRGSKIEQLIDHSVWAKERQRKKKNRSKLDSAVHSLVTKSIWAGRNTPLISGCHFQQSLSPLPWRSRGIPVVEPQHGYCHLRGTTLEKRICLHMFFNQTEQTQSFYILLYNLLKEASWTKKNPPLFLWLTTQLHSVQKREQRVPEQTVYSPQGLCALSN